VCECEPIMAEKAGVELPKGKLLASWKLSAVGATDDVVGRTLREEL